MNKKATELLNEYAALAGKEDAASVARKEEIVGWLHDHADAATKEEAGRFVKQKLGEIEISVDNLRTQIDGEAYRLLPLSYIAERYFGKSAAWLSQRLNGTLVRGRSYTLNEEQKKIFNDAMQDISLRIGSIHLT
nr:MAG TPA: protein of unknown function (DUF5053) [Bacteriophage sp.]